jgi:hypothetical protein
MVALLAVALHLRGLHPFEKALVAAIALGPFLVLFLVVYVVRRRDLAEDDSRPTPKD